MPHFMKYCSSIINEKNGILSNEWIFLCLNKN